ncbi:MAG: hypothetical protein J0M25_10065, partial [Flavobacteriales bacterium]|nr:hypothetical protein [Flavobacteriales bacterium]
WLCWRKRRFDSMCSSSSGEMPGISCGKSRNQRYHTLISLYATFFLVVWMAAKIYRVGILMYGKKPTWKELYKWMKY